MNRWQSFCSGLRSTNPAVGPDETAVGVSDPAGTKGSSDDFVQPELAEGNIQPAVQ